MNRCFLGVVILVVCVGCGRTRLQNERPGNAPATSPEVMPEKLQPLIRALGSDSLQTRVAAADALAKLGPEAKPAVPALLQAMDGRQAWSDFAMMDALSTLGRVALPTLIETLQDKNNKLRTAAGKALWTMGPAAKEALPVLKKLQDDPDTGFKALVEATIKKIEAELSETTRRTSKVAVEAAASPAPVQSRDDGDWPGFRGPQRDGLCPETGLLARWPDAGLKLFWQREGLGKGLSTVSIAGGRLLTTGDLVREGQPASQYAMAFDLDVRKLLWVTRIGGPYKEWGAIGTPTIDGPNAYVVSTDGELLCLDVASGAVRWQRSFSKDFGGKMMSGWPFSESPLVDGDRVLCTPGGKDAVLAALHKQTGKTLWKCPLPPLGERGKDGAAYASPMVTEIEGVRQYVQVVGRGIVGVEAATGRFLWGYNRLANDTANIANPVVRGNLVFFTNGYSTGSALLRITKDGGQFRADEVYRLASKEFQNHHGGAVLAGDCVFGGSGMGKALPTCVDFASGEIRWQAKPPAAGSAAVLYADGHVLFRYDRGLLVWVEANPKAFEVCGSFLPKTVEGPAWAYPVIHRRKLYLRHNDLLLCYDLAGQ